MKHHPVNSSTILSVGHDPETNEMEVSFKSGKTYNFRNVSAQQFENFRLAPSPGKHFHAKFRGNADHAVDQGGDSHE